MSIPLLYIPQCGFLYDGNKKKYIQKKYGIFRSKDSLHEIIPEYHACLASKKVLLFRGAKMIISSGHVRSIFIEST